MNTITSEWYRNLSNILVIGDSVSPRGIKTLELIGCTYSFDMRYPILVEETRKLGTALLCYEPYWYLSGSNKLSDILPYCPRMREFSDDGAILSGAYGPRIVSQLDYVVNCLKEDEHSRKAVMTIWDRNPSSSKDHPCTVSYQFLIRDSSLDMCVTMRSNDWFTGTPYDCFSQTMIAYAVCLLLHETYPELSLGNLILFVGSHHIYEENWTQAEAILDRIELEERPDKSVTKPICYDYSLTFEDLKEYLCQSALTLLKGSPLTKGFLKGLQQKGIYPVIQR